MSEFTVDIRSALQSMIPYEPGKPIEEITREYDLEEPPIKLASNENPFSPPNELKQTYINEFEQLNRYPDGGAYFLKKKLSNHFDWPAEGIVIGAGSDEILDMLAKATLRKNDEVITASPSFIRHKMMAQMMEATSVEVPVSEDFTINVNALIDDISTSTKWICFPNPNNPTSQYVTKSELKKLLLAVPDDSLFIFDEAYFEFMDQPDYPNGLNVLKNTSILDRENIIVLRTFSKAYGLAGLRVGYGFMHPDLVNELNKVRPPFNVTRPGLAVAERALEHNDFVHKSLQQIKTERERLVNALTQKGLEVIPPSANFMLVKVPDNHNASSICEALKRNGIIVRDMSPYGLDNHFRLTVGKPAENTQFLEILNEVL